MHAAPPPETHPAPAVTQRGAIQLAQVRDELVVWMKTLVSAAIYATLIVTFIAQVARVEGQSMAPTLADQDRLIVNKLAYRLADPRRGDIVMLYYPSIRRSRSSSASSPRRTTSSGSWTGRST